MSPFEGLLKDETLGETVKSIMANFKSLCVTRFFDCVKRHVGGALKHLKLGKRQQELVATKIMRQILGRKGRLLRVSEIKSSADDETRREAPQCRNARHCAVTGYSTYA